MSSVSPEAPYVQLHDSSRMKYEEPDHTLALPPQDKISKHEIDLLFLDKLGVL